MAVSPSTASKCWWGRPAQPSGSSSTNPRRMPRTHHGLTRAPKTGSTFADDAQCHLRPSGFRDRTLRVRHLLYLLSHPTGGDRLTRARKGTQIRSEEHTSELQSLMRIPYAVFCLKKKKSIRSTQPAAQTKSI